jgi:hypothetical protein
MHVRRKHSHMLCLILIVGGLLIMMGQHDAPKRCSITSAWKICAKVIASTDPAEFEVILPELRSAIHQAVERLD